MTAELVAVVVIAYLLGSIPFGLIIGKLKSGVDIREQGSGRTGATNLMRVAGTRLGVLALVLDVAKATVAVVLATVIIGRDSGVVTIGGVSIYWQHIAQVAAGLAAVLGHNWPIFAKFRGGRGVTAYFGTVFAIFPPAGIFGAEVLAIAALRSRHMSLGSLLGALATWCLMLPLTIVYKLLPSIYLIYGSVVVALIVYQHRDNIRRLRQGTERRLW
ncbi:MAG: glycerol-3-phosphate 1-O-acyltransferase PlsY [Dehalococcoidia bacterium]|nr:glycerol-3-phosphate 1-O-acyltransferase PlsY [Dehalococcoidia bacterium]MDH4299214.1 glycerol-3-phosphate 1-O-acyltransferase PlsY [Dehalococcoidia bacterium]MDH4367439.1 glycerol-3-phosphate 1-O-acyltransferase PlsY [Dehalococcoidia bacterium]